MTNNVQNATARVEVHVEVLQGHPRKNGIAKRQKVTEEKKKKDGPYFFSSVTFCSLAVPFFRGCPCKTST